MIARVLGIGMLGCFLTSAAIGASLADLVSEANAEWMFGKWQAKTDSGDTISLQISWDLDKKVIVLAVKTPELESKGYTALEPGSEMPRYVSFDNRGAVGKGTWAKEGDELVLRVESKVPDRDDMRTGFTFSGSPSRGLTTRMYSLTASGDLGTERFSISFKKQP